MPTMSDIDGMSNQAWFPQYIQSSRDNGSPQTARYPMYMGDLDEGLALSGTIAGNVL